MMLSELKDRLEKRIYLAHSIAMTLYNKNKDILEDEKIKENIIETLRPIRFDNDEGYFFIGTMDGYDVLYPVAPEVEGSYLWNLQDEKGNFVMQDEVNVIKESVNNEGFVTDYWKKPQDPSKMIYAKLSFVKLFTPFQWYIGTGSYIDTFQEEVKKYIITIFNAQTGNYPKQVFITNENFIIKTGQFINRTLNLDNKIKIKSYSDSDPFMIRDTKLDIIPTDKEYDLNILVKHIKDWDWYIITYSKILKKEAFFRRNFDKDFYQKYIFYFLAMIVTFTLIMWFFLRRQKKILNTSIESFEKYIFNKDISYKNKEKIFREFSAIINGIEHLKQELSSITESFFASQERFNLLQYAQEAGAWDWDIEKNTLYFSDEVFKLTGFTRKQISEYKAVIEKHIHIDDKEILLNDIERLKKNPGNYTREFRVIKDDNINWYFLKGKLIKNTKGEDHFIGIITNITKEKENIENLQKAKEKAETSDKLKSEFLANMSHEIRTPMTSIIGFSDLLKKTQIDKKQEKYIEIIRKSGKYLLVLINDIIDLAKIETNQLHFNNTTIDVENFLQEIVNFFKPETVHRETRIELVNPENEETLLIKADPIRLRQVLINLISNSVKFTEQGHIWVGYKDFESQVEIFVKDTGIGIPKEKLDEIFEKFRQVDSSITRSFGGLGLGLAISRKLIENMGGTITVQSEPGEGTTFYITIDKLQKKVTKVITKGEESGERKGNGEKILIIDDTRENVIFLKELIEAYNYTPITAFSGKDSVEIYKKNTDIKIAFIDIQMPGMDGFETFKKLKEISTENQNELYCIALTAHAMADDERICLQKGFNAYISKPYKTWEIFKNIEKFL